MEIMEFVNSVVKSNRNEDKFSGELNLDSLGTFLISNKNVIKDRNKVKSILKDIMPHDKLHCNLLMIGYDAGVLSLVDKVLNDELLFKYRNKLEKEHGVTSDNADWIIVTWLSVIFKLEIPKSIISDRDSVKQEDNNSSINKGIYSAVMPSRTSEDLSGEI